MIDVLKKEGNYLIVALPFFDGMPPLQIPKGETL